MKHLRIFVFLFKKHTHKHENKKALAVALIHCQLKTLRITNSNISSKNSIPMFEALTKTEQFTTLQHLNITKNNVDKIGSKVIQISFFFV